MENFSFDTALNKIDFVFEENQFKDEAKIVKTKAFVITKVSVAGYVSYA